MSLPKDPFRKRAAGFTGFGKKAFGAPRSKKNPFNAAEVRPPDLDSDDFEYTLAKLGNPALVKRVLSLKNQFPNGTTPELVTMDWLNRNQVRYIYQAQYGARAKRGSSSTDFVVEANGRGMAWEINGVYWHTKHKTPESDASRRLLLINRRLEGVLITSVVALWEPDIYRNPDKVFQNAMMGLSSR